MAVETEDLKQPTQPTGIYEKEITATLREDNGEENENDHISPEQQQQQQINIEKEEDQNDFLAAISILIIGCAFFPPFLLFLSKYRNHRNRAVRIAYRVGIIFFILNVVGFLIEILLIIFFFILYSVLLKKP
mmetsp:Transcript_3855/g.5705  ORF Transcript_3855/g.5705 Transcript_3855/m.5705 type:complete len:132 (+) Transcript_3855:74-469(+)